MSIRTKRELLYDPNLTANAFLEIFRAGMDSKKYSIYTGTIFGNDVLWIKETSLTGVTIHIKHTKGHTYMYIARNTPSPLLRILAGEMGCIKSKGVYTDVVEFVDASGIGITVASTD